MRGRYTLTIDKNTLKKDFAARFSAARQSLSHLFSP
jgi:hypothetical protein